MQEFDHIKSLWQGHEVEVKVSADEMLHQAKKEVNAIKRKSAFNLISMIGSFTALCALWFFIHFDHWTTHIGLSIILISIAVYTFILYRDYKIIDNLDFTENPNTLVNRLKGYQINRYLIYNRLYWFYVIALSIGCLLYFIEVLHNFSTPMQYLIILLTAGWIIFCSTIVRKAVMNREKERIALLIEKFERIGNQFDV